MCVFPIKKIFILVTVLFSLEVLPSPYILADVHSPLTVDLSMKKPPLLNQRVEITWQIKAASNTQGVNAKIVLPNGADILSGPAIWEGDLMAGQVMILSTEIMFHREGNQKIEARVQKVLDEKNIWGDIDTIYLNIGAASSRFGYWGLKTKPLGTSAQVPRGPVREIKKNFIEEFPVPREKKLSDDQPSGQVTAGELTVQGCFYYYDKGGNFVPAIYTPVHLYDHDDASADDLLEMGLTDSDGCFLIGPVDNEDGEYGTQDIYLEFVLETDHRAVEGSGALEGVYYWPTPTFDNVPDGNFTFGTRWVDDDDPYEGAMWIFQTMGEAYRYVSAYGEPGYAEVEWDPDNDGGTRYTEGDDIYLDGGDAGAPDVIVHEMGHNYMWNIYGEWMPDSNCPDPHYITGYSNIICAWTEGWADFLPLAVYNDPIFNWLNSSMDLEYPTGSWDNGDGVEGRVAGALWDIFDSTDDGFDQYTDGFEEIWDTIYNQNDETFSQYWYAWNERGHNHDAAVLSVLENTINYRDGTEKDFLFEEKSIKSGEEWYFQTTNTITAQNGFNIQSGASVTFDANNEVRLKGSFSAKNGSEFRARN